MGNNIKVKKEEFFDRFPVLHTDRFILRKMTSEYLTNLIEELSDAETMEHSGMIIFDVEKQAKMFIEKIEVIYQNKTGIRWAITDKNSGEYVGNIGFYNIDLYSNHTELGYTISKKFWRQGIATECIRKVTEFAFEEFEMNKVILMIDDRNKKSINLANKLKFNYDGIQREQHYIKSTNEYISMNIFSKLKREYKCISR